MATIQGIYVALFGRPADPAGLAYFNSVTTNGADLSGIGNLTGSAEYLDRFKGFSNRDIVNTIYQNLLARDGEKVGLDYWVGRLADGSITVQNLAIAMLDAAQGSDAATVTNKVLAANLFTKSLDTPAEIAAYNGIASTKGISDYLKTVTSSNPPDASKIDHIVLDLITPPDNGGPSITHIPLTTAVDNLKTGSIGYTAFDGTLGGVSPTVNAGDKLVGTGTKNSLDITDTDTGHDLVLPALDLSGIQTITANTAEGLTVDAATWTNVETINISGSDHSRQLVVNGGASTKSVSLTGGVSNTITDLNHGSGTANTIASVSLTNNGTSAAYSLTTVSSDALTSLTLINEATGVQVDAMAGNRTLALTLNGTGPGYVSSTGGLVKDNTATALTVTTTGAASSMFIQADTATVVDFKLGVNLVLSDFIAQYAQSISITGGGNFSGNFSGADAAAVIDAHGASGTVTATLVNTGAQGFTGGSGRDIVSIGAGQTGTVTGGGGNNQIFLDSLAATDITTALGNLQNHVSGFSTFGVSGTVSGTYGYYMTGMTAYTAFVVKSSGADVSFLNAHGSSLTIEASNAAQAIALATDDNTASTDTATLTLGTADTTGITVGSVFLEDTTGAYIATVNIVSNGTGVNTVGAFSTSSQNMQTINLSGTAGVDLSQRPLQSVTVSGAADHADNKISVVFNSSVSLGNGNNTVHTDSGITSVTLGDGNNHVRADFGTNTIVLGNGNNEVTTFRANGTVTLGTGQNTVTAGEGTVTINLAASHTGGNDTIIISPSQSVATTITHMLAGDHLKIIDADSFDTTAVTAAQVADTTLLSSWVDAALSSSGANLAQHEAGWFQFNGDTYVVEQAETQGTALTYTDTLVKLTGLIDLSTSHYDNASGTIII